MTDPIADMLTRIRNALIVKHDTVEVPASNMKKSIAKILLDEGYIVAYDVVRCRRDAVLPACSGQNSHYVEVRPQGRKGNKRT